MMLNSFAKPSSAHKPFNIDNKIIMSVSDHSNKSQSYKNAVNCQFVNLNMIHLPLYYS